MPEITFADLPQILEKNKEIFHEVDQYKNKYLKDCLPKGWGIIDGSKMWIEENHYLVQAPIEDSTLGGFIFFIQPNKNLFYLNTWQPRVYQNFILLHEIFHAIANGITEYKVPHMIQSDMDRDYEERKADYFASLLLLDANEVTTFYKSLKTRKVLHKVFYTMSRFLAPYKAVLIRLYELNLITVEILKEMFDTKLDFSKEFEKLGLDPSPVQRSCLLNVNQLEEMIESKENLFPEVANENNKKTLEAVKAYFEKNKE